MNNSKNEDGRKQKHPHEEHKHFTRVALLLSFELLDVQWCLSEKFYDGLRGCHSSCTAQACIVDVNAKSITMANLGDQRAAVALRREGGRGRVSMPLTRDQDTKNVLGRMGKEIQGV